MKKYILLTLLFLPLLIYAQKGESDSFRKFGVGIGYSFNSVMGDSIRPVEFSVRYRINNKHTLQVYAPLLFNRRSVKEWQNNVHRKIVWGIGLGYDYTFYSYSNINFFTGLNIDYQKYEKRWDLHKTVREIFGESYIENELVYYTWNRLNGFNFYPNWGVRVRYSRVMVEAKISIPVSVLKREQYAFGKSRYSQYDDDFPTKFELFFPDEKFSEVKIQPNLSLNLLYYF